MNERDRIELIMRCYSLTPSQFADRAGVQRASVSHILSGRNKPSLDVLLKIFEAFPGLDMQWLMTGKGNPPAENTMGAEQPAPDNSSAFMQSELFPQEKPMAPVNNTPVERTPQRGEQRPPAVTSERAPKRAPRTVSHSVAPAVTKKIKEIRVFYTDGTYETMFPEK